MRFLTVLAMMLALACGNARAQQVVTPTTAPNTQGITSTAVTCGTTSTPFGVTAIYYLHIHIPNGAPTVWFAWNSNTATTSPPSEDWTGANGPIDITWGGGTGSCIVASGTQVITVITK
jgi:hypothetical protein